MRQDFNVIYISTRHWLSLLTILCISFSGLIYPYNSNVCLMFTGMDLRTSSKFRQTTTGAQLRRRREQGPGLGLGSRDDGQNIRTFSRQLNHYQTQVFWFINSILLNFVRIMYFGGRSSGSQFGVHSPVIFTFKNFNWHHVRAGSGAVFVDGLEIKQSALSPDHFALSFMLCL